MAMIPQSGLRAARRLGEFAAALLCIWAALGHTPAGALLRLAAARLTGTHSAARPLFAYYSGGVYEAAAAAAPLPPPPKTLAHADALGAGAWSALSTLRAAEAAQVLAAGKREGFSPAALADPRTGPAQLGALLGRLKARWGSEDLAMLALFCGEEAARYARTAAGGEAELPALVRALPGRLCERGALAGQALSLAVAYGLDWPVAVRVRVSSPFGNREHPTLGGVRPHRGVDLSLPVGTPVRAGGPAVVRRASEDEVNGRMVVLDHGRGVSCAFLHNSALSVERGDQVSRGREVARSGNSGRSTGPHLHYQLELSGVAVDPLRYRALRGAAAE